MAGRARHEGHILGTLARFSQRLDARDLEGVLDLFWPDDDVILVGSEAGEVARGREEIRRALEELFGRGEAYSFDWERHDISMSGDLAWLFAEGVVAVRGDDGMSERLPYRVGGV